MRTYKRIAIGSAELRDTKGNVQLIERGKEYITSAEHEDGTVTVFKEFWERFPVELFAGEIVFTER